MRRPAAVAADAAAGLEGLEECVAQERIARGVERIPVRCRDPGHAATISACRAQVSSRRPGQWPASSCSRYLSASSAAMQPCGGVMPAGTRVSDVARGEHAGTARRRGAALAARAHDDVAALHLELASKICVFGVWPTAMNTPATLTSASRRLRSARAHAGDARVVAEHVLHGWVPDDLDRASGSRSNSGPAGSSRSAACQGVDQRDVRGDVRQVQRLSTPCCRHRSGDALPRKKNPSQVAQADTPRRGTPARTRGRVTGARPVAMMSASQVYSPRSP